jgi:hypothetical protein
MDGPEPAAAPVENPSNDGGWTEISPFVEPTDLISDLY